MVEIRLTGGLHDGVSVTVPTTPDGRPAPTLEFTTLTRRPPADDLVPLWVDHFSVDPASGPQWTATWTHRVLAQGEHVTHVPQPR